MSGQHIIIEQLREELEKAHAASEYQTRRIEHYRTQLDFCERRAEKAERFIATADSEWKVRAEKAERERDEARAEREALRRHYDEAGPEHNLLALLDLYDERRAAAESERDEARAERDARPDISAEDARAFMMFKPVPARDSREGPVMHALRAHAAKAVNP